MSTSGKRIPLFLMAVALMALVLSVPAVRAQDFTVVIDAGHGGHDPGAIGKTSREKNINLNVALKLGRLIEDNCKDVKVIYTRKTDVFITLDKRAQIANDAKADLFISVHTNSLANNRTATGPSTWTLGLAKSADNLNVAKRENSVILYEDDYKVQYAGFDPNSSESYIIFEFMQDQYMSQSVQLASLVQKYFKNTGRRIDNGVHQAGFLVLKASAMPSILVELGFISTPSEERFLNTEDGQKLLADCIYRAFLDYKDGQTGRDGNAGTKANTDTAAVQSRPATTATTTQRTTASATSTAPAATKTTQDNGDSRPVFKVQILVSSRQLPDGDRQFKGLSPVDCYVENGMYKYTYGASADYNKVRSTLRTVTAKFKDAFIVAFRDGEKMNVNQAIREFKNRK